MTDRVVEVDPSVGRSDEPQQSFGNPDRKISVAEQILANTIAEYPGPIIKADDAMHGRSDEHPTALAQAQVFRIITGYSNFDLERALKRSPYLRDTLGFEDVPDHTTFAYGWRGNLFEEHTREYLREYATWIQDELDDLDCAEVEPYLVEETTEHEQLPEMPDGEIDSAIEHVRGLMLDGIDFQRGENTTYEAADLMDVALDASRERASMNAVIDENGHDPELKTVLNAVKNRSGLDWHDAFQAINSQLLDAAKGTGMLDRPLEAYLDITVIPFYPQELDEPAMARGNEKKAGTMHGFHFGTIVGHDPESNKDMALAMLPYTPDMRPYNLLTLLVKEAEQHCSIKHLHADSEFSGVECIRFLKQEGIGYTTRMKRHGDRIKGALAAMSGRFDDHERYRVGGENVQSTHCRLVAEPDWNNADEETLRREIETSQHTFADYGDNDTEIPDVSDVPAKMWQCRRPYVTTDKESSPEQAIYRYKQRWRVENAYADKKRALLAETQSRDHGVRVFLFTLTTILYNAWMLTRTCLRLDFPDHAPQDRPPVTLRQFIKTIVQFEFG